MTTAIDKKQTVMHIFVALLSIIVFSSFLHAKTVPIKPTVIKLSKAKVKNKNIHFTWNSKQKKLIVKRNKKFIQNINFGVKPQTIELIDVNFDGYADVVLQINEDEEGKYAKKGMFLHFFYYIYDKKKRKFIYHKELTKLIYESTQNYDGEMKGFHFDGKSKRLVLGDKATFFYGVKIYTLKGRELALKKRGFRLFPAYYPDGVGVEYKYKKGKVKTIKVLKDGKPTERESFSIDVTEKKYKSKQLNPISKKVELEYLLLENIYHTFENHQFQTFSNKHFYYKENRTDETSLMDVVLMLDSVFKRDGKKKKDDTLFELLHSYSKIKNIQIENFVFDEKKSMYILDVALNLTDKTQKYRWHFYIDKYENGIYFLPISYNQKQKTYMLLNDNYTFDSFQTQGLRLTHRGKELQISTPWVHNGKEQWHISEEKCWTKYIEFGLNDYTGNGHIDWFNTCTNSLVKRRESTHVIRFGGKYQFHVMLQPFAASKYFWNKKKNRVTFVSTWNGGSYQVCERYINDKKEKSMQCKKYYTDYKVKDYFKVGNKYINKKLFEESLEENELYFTDSRRKVKKATLLYSHRKDIVNNKPYVMLKEDTLVVPTGKTIPYWENNVSLTQPLKIDGIHYYNIDNYIERVELDEKDTVPWNVKFGKPAPTVVYAIIYYKNNKYYMDINNYKEK